MKMTSKDFKLFLSTVDKDKFINYWQSHSDLETANYFKIFDRRQVKKTILSIAPLATKNKHEVNINSVKKRKTTNLNRYNVELPAQSNEILKKIRRTNLMRYGVTCTLSAPSIRQKIEQDSLSKYGVKNPASSLKSRQQAISSMLSKYKTCQGNHLYKYGSIYFDSSWELCFFIYLQDHQIDFVFHPETYFEYEVNGKTHRYYPDFLVKNEFIEIKGDQFFKSGKFENPFLKSDLCTKKKYECMIKNHVKIMRYLDVKPYLSYVETRYGKNFCETFKVLHKNKKTK